MPEAYNTGPAQEQHTMIDAAARRVDPYGPVHDRNRDCLLNELVSYKKLPEGWDGYDGLRPQEQTIDDAILFVDKLPEGMHRVLVPLPKPSLGGDGELVLYWRFQESYAEASFMGDGHFSFYSAVDKRQHYCFEDRVISDSFDDEMEKIASILIEFANKRHELS